ncbi:MAG: hypothetical protein CM15mP101_06870 [Flavobacteriaceae bacterium]|nr:MAG: hypothetical protein CM15mP101_06870 [Flavobacteriaceae bacterium]
MRHAVSNDDGTFGYKINARYSENNEFKLTDQAYESLGQSSDIFDPIGFSPTGYDTGVISLIKHILSMLMRLLLETIK